LKKAVGMAYVDTTVSKVGQVLWGTNKGKKSEIKISKMPFVPSRYYKI